MDLIIPYDEQIYKSEGAFITPEGCIIPAPYKHHEQISSDYCYGKDYSTLYAKQIVSCYQSGKKVNPFASSKLTKEELEMFKAWIASQRPLSYTDFLVLVLRWDKAQNVMQKAIVTTSPTPHIRYYNYYLMDWFLDIKNPLKLDAQTGIFLPAEQEKDYSLKLAKDIEAKEELDELRSSISLKDRPTFFK